MTYLLASAGLVVAVLLGAAVFFGLRADSRRADRRADRAVKLRIDNIDWATQMIDRKKATRPIDTAQRKHLTWRGRRA